ncbi:MAG: nitrite/sulfite reductase, partial [Bacteroidota bacterium]
MNIHPKDQEDILELKRRIAAYNAGQEDDERFKLYRLTRGVYGQRQTGVQMFRTKIPFGKLTSSQLETIADISDQYSTGNLHITTRQNIQLHYVKLEDSPKVWEALAANNLTAREACGNTVRNITASEIAGIDPKEPFDVAPYAQASFEYFLRNPICQEMGRKIKPAFSSNEQDSAFAYFHDFGFIPRIKEIDGETVRGFKVLLAGGLGAVSIVAHPVYEFLPADQIIPFMEACIRVFDRYGEREKRMKARMKFLVKKLGLEAFMELVEEEKKALPAQTFPIEAIETEVQLPASYDTSILNVDPVDQHRYELWKATNVIEQKQKGYHAVYLKVLLGNISSDTSRALAQLVRLCAADDIRLTINQGMLLRYVKPEVLPFLFNQLDKLALASPGFNSTADVT